MFFALSEPSPDELASDHADPDLAVAGQVVLWPFGRIQQGGHHGRHHGASADSLPFDQAEHFYWVEVVNRDVRAADDSDGVGGTPSVGVNSCAGKKYFQLSFQLGDYTGVCTWTMQSGSIQTGRPRER